MKFGGSSVGSPERLLLATDLIAQHHPQGPLAVVVSAMGETTDWLIEAARLAALGQSDSAKAIAQRVGDLARANARQVLKPLAGRAALSGSSLDRIERAVEATVGPLKVLLEAIGCVKETTKKMLGSVVSL